LPVSQVGNAQMHGFTAVAGLFLVPERTLVVPHLSFENEAGVDAAYAALVETRSKLRAAARPPPVC